MALEETMKVMCRRDPDMVRAYLGLGEGQSNALFNAAALLRKPSTLQQVDPDQLDTYIEDIERYEEAISEVETMAYGARRDYEGYVS